MIAILQLNPPWWVMTPRGFAYARALIDYGPDTNTVFLCDSERDRQCFAVDSAEIRFGENAMWDLQEPEPFGERNV